jgi:hypothetical protein
LNIKQCIGPIAESSSVNINMQEKVWLFVKKMLTSLTKERNFYRFAKRSNICTTRERTNISQMKCSCTKIFFTGPKWFGLWGFNATFNNISAISWLLVLLVEETGIPRENPRPVASHLSNYHMITTTTAVVHSFAHGRTNTQ